MCAESLHSEYFKNRRKRRKIQPDEHEILEQVFTKTSHPSTVLRNILGAQLNMSARSVQIWFQNRRAKAKKTCAKLRSAHQKKEEPASNKETDSSQKRSLELDNAEYEDDDSFSEEEFTDEEVSKLVQNNSSRVVSPIFTCSTDLVSPRLTNNNFSPRSVQCTSPTVALCGSSEPDKFSSSGPIYQFQNQLSNQNIPAWRPSEVVDLHDYVPIAKAYEGTSSSKLACNSPEIPVRLWNSLMSGLPLEAQGKFNGKKESKPHDLLNAALLGFESKLKCLVEEGVDVNSRDEKGNTALILASSRGHLNIVRYLLDCGAIARSFNFIGRNALFEATANGFIHVVEELMKVCDSRDVEMQETYTCKTPLHYAVESGSLELCSLLLKKGANPYRADSKGRTAIEIAALRGLGYLRGPLLQYGSHYFQQHKVHERQPKRDSFNVQQTSQVSPKQFQQVQSFPREPMLLFNQTLNSNISRCSDMWNKEQVARISHRSLCPSKETPKVALV